LAIDFSEKKVKAFEEIYGTYLSSFLTILTYTTEEALADEQEQKFQQTLNKARKGK
jgi:hypothetical protein